MPDTVSELARRLADNAEAVCRQYLSNGRRRGRYWLVGDVRNTPGQSLYVRLRGPGSGRGAAGKWADAATGEHGDLLDLIAATRGLQNARDVLDEARHFLRLTSPQPELASPAPAGSPHVPRDAARDAGRRLFAMARPIGGTLAETYLRARGITDTGDTMALRFHPRCFYRAELDSPDTHLRGGKFALEAWPALLAAVTDAHGAITGVQRTWLDPSGTGKAPVATPRRAMGQLLGHAVRFGTVHDTLAVGEGIETVLSLRSALPTLPLAAALSAGNLAAVLFPAGLRRLYIARDNDRAGSWAAEKLAARAEAVGIEAIALTPEGGDFNDDLQQRGPRALAAALRVQLAPEDVTRFWRPPERGER